MPIGNSAVSSAIDNYINQNIDQTDEIHYDDPEQGFILKGNLVSSRDLAKEKGSSSTPLDYSIFIKDIAQSHHFKIHLSDFGNMSGFVSPDGTWSKFLPVKNINLNYTSYENMSIPLAIFGDFPLLNKKRVSTIALTCYDLDSNELEYLLRQWEYACFPKGRYVAYMEDIIKTLTYDGYSVKGKKTLSCSFNVIPSGNVTVSRDYSINDAKLISFSLVCVGDGVTCATGDGSKRTEQVKNQQLQREYNENELVINRGLRNRLSGDAQTTYQGFKELLKNRELPT